MLIFIEKELLEKFNFLNLIKKTETSTFNISFTIYTAKYF
jgi:hypothetical protein